jgi:hypothetical protein
MIKHSPVSPTPGPLEDHSQSLDSLCGARAQRQGFRRYLEGLLLPAERTETLTALDNTELVVEAQHAQAQSLQWFFAVEAGSVGRKCPRGRVATAWEPACGAQ